MHERIETEMQPWLPAARIMRPHRAVSSIICLLKLRRHDAIKPVAQRSQAVFSTSIPARLYSAHTQLQIAHTCKHTNYQPQMIVHCTSCGRKHLLVACTGQRMCEQCRPRVRTCRMLAGAIQAQECCNSVYKTMESTSAKLILSKSISKAELHTTGVTEVPGYLHA